MMAPSEGIALTRRATCRRVRRLAVVVALVGVVAAQPTAASATWTSPGSGDVRASSLTLDKGKRPRLSASGSTVTVSWRASTLSNGAAVGGYTVRRYTRRRVLQAAQPGCSGTVTGLTCTELGVPAGSWLYSVTPVIGGWQGAESPRARITV